MSMNFYDPIDYHDNFMRNFFHREMMGFAARSPQAQAKIVGVTEPLVRPEIREEDMLPDGDTGYEVAAMPELGIGRMIIVPTHNRYGERTGLQALKKTPLWTRHMLGVQEAARARRRSRR